MKKGDMDPLNVALVGLFVVLAINVFLYFRPKYIQEGFATIAIDGERIPQCLIRDSEAQALLASLDKNSPHYDEFKMIVQKALCMDADITGSAAGPYSTYQLPFATAHDIEPVASFVGRCVRRVVRSRDIEMVIGKFEERGNELLKQLCAKPDVALQKFRGILMRVMANISPVCIAPKANLDTPVGVRDPGYFEPESVKHLQEYTIKGGVQYF